jgi:phage terminase large subunit
MQIEIDYGKEINKPFEPSFWDTSRYDIEVGSAGSGKSYYGAFKLLYRALTESASMPRPHKILVVRKTQPSVRDSCFPLVKGYLNKWKIPYHASDLNIRLMNGAHFLFKGLDDSEKIKSIEGITAIWIEEPTGIHRKDFEQLDLRLRGETGTYKQIILTFNPSTGKTSWLYQSFFLTSNPDAFVHKSTYKDNRFIDKEYIEKLEKITDPHFAKIYREGEWTELARAVYSDVEIRHFTIEQVKDILNKTTNVYAGVDFGFSDPNVFELLAEIENDVYVLKEIYRTGQLNIDFAREIREICKTVDVDYARLPIYCEDAEPDKIKEFRTLHGLTYARPAKKKLIASGIAEVKKRHLIINDECVKAAEQIPAYSYQEDKDGNVLEEPVGFNDHTCAAVRYGVYGKKSEGVKVYFG